MKLPAMTVSSGRRLSVMVVGVAISVITVFPALAQLLPGGQDAIATGRHSAAPEKPTPRPADAMPGAKAREPAAPATRPAGDMQPTEALFDAINRGDIASARDALNRGADLNGVNILGMTPMELSVDLGRNDISFLLLSMRGEDSGRGSRSLGRDSSAPAAKILQSAKETAPAKTAKVVNPPVAARSVATPKLFANDGGAPLPSAGFLGFGTRSASN